MPLPNFTFTGSIFVVHGETASSELTSPALGARVLFTPNLPTNSFVVWEDDIYLIKAVDAKVVSDGTIVRGAANDPVRLLANDAGLNVDGIRWTCDISLGNEAIVSVSFEAPADGATVALEDIIPAPVVS